MTLRFKTKLPSQYCIEPIQINLFKLGFTWKNKTTNIIPWYELSEYFLFIDISDKTIEVKNRYDKNSFFKFEAQYLDYSHLLYGLDRFQKYDWDQQQYDNMLYWEKEGYKYEL